MRGLVTRYDQGMQPRGRRRVSTSRQAIFAVISAQSAQWIVPATAIYTLILRGAGGSGCAAVFPSNYFAYGGGSGGITRRTLPLTAGSVLTYSVGLGGVGAFQPIYGSHVSGTNGGSTSLSLPDGQPTLTATGGGGGSFGATNDAGSTAGVGDLNGSRGGNIGSAYAGGNGLFYEGISSLGGSGMTLSTPTNYSVGATGGGGAPSVPEHRGGDGTAGVCVDRQNAMSLNAERGAGSGGVMVSSPSGQHSALSGKGGDGVFLVFVGN